MVWSAYYCDDHKFQTFRTIVFNQCIESFEASSQACSVMVMTKLFPSKVGRVSILNSTDDFWEKILFAT